MSTYTRERFDHAGLGMLVRRYHSPAADGQEFLLIHGIGVSPRYFARLAEKLRPHGTVYVVELPGFGSTPRPDHPVSIEQFAGLLLAFCDSWSLVNPVLIGHSMGTQIVAEMAVQQPGVSDRLVLMGPVIDPKAPTALHQGWRLFRDMLMETPGANWIVSTDYLRCGAGWYFTELPAMLQYPMDERLPLVTAPTLLIRGSRDPVAPAEWLARMARLLPQATSLDVPGAAHVVQHTAAAGVAQAILDHTGTPVVEPALQHGPDRD